MVDNNKLQTNFIVDSIGYLAFLVLLSTGVIMKFILLPGKDRGASDPTSLMGYGRHDWGEVHFWASVLFVTAIVLHLILHWSWLVMTFRSQLRVKTKVGVGVALVLPILVVVLPFWGARAIESDSEHGPGLGRPASLESRNSETNPSQTNLMFMIRGRTTLQEIETATGLAVEEILQAMNLPADMPRQEPLNVLRNQYEFDMHDFRETVTRLLETDRIASPDDSSGNDSSRN